MCFGQLGQSFISSLNLEIFFTIKGKDAPNYGPFVHVHRLLAFLFSEIRFDATSVIYVMVFQDVNFYSLEHYIHFFCSYYRLMCRSLI